MTAAPEGVDELRTRWGSPKQWTRPGMFGVLLSSSNEVTARTYDSCTDLWDTVETLSQAHAYGASVRRAQLGLEFEVMRLEHGTWRDFLGRTAHEVINARWSQ